MSKYATLSANISYLLNTMYHIIIDNKTIESLDSKEIAFANFRSLCRDYKNKPSGIKLMLDDELLYAKPADLQLLDDIDETVNNDILKQMISKLNIDVKQLKAIIKDSPLNLSNSRIDGWLRNDPTDRRYTPMHNDELYCVLELLLPVSVQTMSYSANNLVTMRKQLGLTQQALAEILSVSGSRQVRRWEKSEQSMSAETWNKFLDYYHKNLNDKT